MLPREYLNKYRISVSEFARRAGVLRGSIWHYFAGRRRPSQKTAERLEKASDGLVTVLEWRGKDDRKR